MKGGVLITVVVAALLWGAIVWAMVHEVNEMDASLALAKEQLENRLEGFTVDYTSVRPSQEGYEVGVSGHVLRNGTYVSVHFSATVDSGVSWTNKSRALLIALASEELWAELDEGDYYVHATKVGDEWVVEVESTGVGQKSVRIVVDIEKGEVEEIGVVSAQERSKYPIPVIPEPVPVS